jgi:hypothetical protein
MANRQTIIRTVIAAAILTVSLPLLASAQGGYDPYRRDRDNRNDRNYGYDRRTLRDAIHRVKDRSKDFERSVDSALDNSRYNGRNREDRINNEAKQFRDAANDLKSRFGNGNDLSRSANEANRLLQLGSRIENFVQRSRLDNRTMNYWYQIRQDLNVISNAYRIGGGGYGRDGDYRNDRNGRGSFDPRVIFGNRWP